MHCAGAQSGNSGGPLPEARQAGSSATPAPATAISQQPSQQAGQGMARGEWHVYAVRFRPARAQHVSVHSVTLTLRGSNARGSNADSLACRVTFLLSTAYSPADPTTMPLVLTGCPAHDALSPTGRHAPFAGITPAPEPGILALTLQYDLPPPDLTLTTLPTHLVGEPARVAVLVTSAGSMFDAKVTIVTRAVHAASRGPVALTVLTGDTFECAVPLPVSCEVALPSLRKGASATVVLWVLAHAVCDVTMSAVVACAGAPTADAASADFSVAEPFRFDAKMVSEGSESVLMREVAAPDGGAQSPHPKAIRAVAGVFQKKKKNVPKPPMREQVD